MSQVEESAVVKRSPEEVFALVGDPKNDGQWASTVREARQTSPGPLGVGTTFEQTVRLLGRRIELGIEVTEYEPNRKLAIRLISGPVKGTGRRIVDPADGGTRLTLAAEGRSGLFFNLAEPLVAWAIRRELRAGLAKLKEMLEGPD
ncbi:MAG: SRPBCC family protein [Actinobacteria bacterium]|nr:SRPBCC family protein [Actinomycetota bacterium]